LVRTHRVREARTWIDRALALADPADPRKVDLLAAAVTAAEADADYASLREHASEMLALAKSARQRAQLGRVCDALGNAEKHLGNGKAAVQWYTSALAHYRACGDEHGRALVLLDLGAAAADIDLDFTRAHAYFLEALEIFQQLGSTPDVGVALAKAGAVAGQMGDYDSAIAYSSQSLSVFERVANPCAQAWQLVSIAHYRIERQEWERAAAALRSAHGILQEHPHREYSAMLLEVGLYLAGDLKRDELTARIAGYLHAYRERERVPRLASAQRHYDGRVQRARRRLGTHAFEAAFASGAQAAPDALVAEVIRA
jgi:tetratricopeptide (TPR) repeat protein